MDTHQDTIPNKSDRTYQVTEVCPHCESEVTMTWNTDADGFRAFCPHCGQRLMLCDECSQVGGNACNYDRETDSCKYNPPREKTPDGAC